MDCNKDEATRAKEIAERKLSAKDMVGAKKFALKAHKLCPNLEGLSQMLAVIDVYISAEIKLGGESDWYGILGATPYSDDEALRKQYRKLALVLHPDKNKSLGAEGAFKFISEAWQLLSDKTKRVEYDRKRISVTTQQKAPPSSWSPASRSPSAPPGSNGFSNHTDSTSSDLRPPKTSTYVGPKSDPTYSRSPHKTFWTACDKCQMLYEYARMFLNNKLRCPNCREPFTASEIAAPPRNDSKAWSSQQCHKSTKVPPTTNVYAPGRSTASTPNLRPMGFTSQGSFQTNGQFGPSSTVAGNATASVPSAKGQTANVNPQASEEFKQMEGHEGVRTQDTLLQRTHLASKRKNGVTGCNPSPKGDKPVKRRRRVDDSHGNEYAGNSANQTTTGNGGSGRKQTRFETGSSDAFSTGGKRNSTRDLSQLELRNMLLEKARREIRKKLQEWSMAASAKATKTEMVMGKKKGKDKKGVAMIGEKHSQNKSRMQIDTEKEVQEKKACSEPPIDPEIEILEPMSMNVPDPDFHDFDMDRSESSFEENQIWASYDEDDGMPRYYAMIRSVVSLKPFKIRIGWLNSKTNIELGPLPWIKSGYSKVCGDYKVGKYEINNSLNSFSHKVKWTKGINGSIQIYPSKGDVWALYHNWSPDWNELTPDEVIHKYDMVEVVDEYTKEGVSVAPLIKVPGFKIVFRRHFDAQKVKRIPREEMFQFSHQVPSYLLTGQEAQGAPQGCLELDPAATPLELLQVITETEKQDALVGADEGTKEPAAC